jgi:hypothetical protein
VIRRAVEYVVDRDWLLAVLAITLIVTIIAGVYLTECVWGYR